jgi:phenylpropionate dioxygenase-like ring-hydroxylating dioxygenase large terminal subunit
MWYIILFLILGNTESFTSQQFKINFFKNNLFKTNFFKNKFGLKTIHNNFAVQSDNINDDVKNVSNHKHEFFHYGIFPRLDDGPNENGQLTWYPIGFSKNFGMKPQKITIRDLNYVVWKDKTSYYGIRDCCSHQGSSFMLGETCKNTITCPYHGYIFDGTNGELVKIPKLPHVESVSHNIDCFKVVEKGDIVYFNTIPIRNESMKLAIDESKIFVEPEYYDRDQRAVYLSEDFEHYAKFVSVNSLDICHIGFVHTFGNKKSPNPLHNSKVLKMDDYDHHYKIIYEYMAGENSIVSKIYNFENITVENEYTLPHSTVARVKFGNLSSTIITHALPISKFQTKLFVKAYRNYLSYDVNDVKNQNILYPLLYLINILGDKFTKNTMFNTLKEDKSIVDHIDKTNYHDMHGKFSIVYDLFSNHYKANYKKFYEEGPLQM